MVYYGELGKKADFFGDKISLTGCKWSSLNAPNTDTPVSHSLFESSRFPFSAPVSSCLLISTVYNGELGKKVEKFRK